jgi:putative protein-disulfide isomerase
MTGRKLFYVLDPMCSWCWGFSLVFAEIIRRYEDRMPIELMMGGLRPGNTQPFDAQKRATTLKHWQAVHARTGQPFDFSFRMSSGFIYDTEPASRAIKVVQQMARPKERAYLHSLQAAFYMENRDVTRDEVLSEIAQEKGLDRAIFHEIFHDPTLKKTLREEFARARKWGVDGFPALLGRDGAHLLHLMRGYQDLDTIVPSIDHWLAVGDNTHFKPVR